MGWLQEWLLLWLIHVLGWFVFSSFVTMLRGGWSALALRYCIPIGAVSATLHMLVQFYARTKGYW